MNKSRKSFPTEVTPTKPLHRWAPAWAINKSLLTSGIFITGTDTGVGKTIVTAGLVRALRMSGIDAGVMKPVATGGMAFSSDVRLLSRATGVTDPLDLINPVRLKLPLAPLLSARLSKTTINLKRIFSAYETLRKRHEVMLVEGIGGLLVPITGNYLVADLVGDMKLPLLIVSRPSLGTINHTLLTISAARDYGLKIMGVIINYHGPTRGGLAERYAPGMIEEISGVPCLGIIPHLNRRELSRATKPFRSIIRTLYNV